MIHQSDEDRLLDLLADRALFGLTDDQQQQLDSLLMLNPGFDSNCMDRIAGMLTMTTVHERTREMPHDLVKRVSDGMAPFVRDPGRTLPSSAGGNVPVQPPLQRGQGWSTLAMMSGWMAAAALLIAFLLPEFLPRPNAQDVLAKQRAELISTGDDSLILREWTRTEDPAAVNASGNVVWDNQKQEGYMTLSGLPSLKAEDKGYQLWIFDAQGDERYPVDGGFFNIPEGRPEVIIPIDAKIPVREPTLFAITIEQQNGVVVSDRKRLPLLAPPENDVD